MLQKRLLGKPQGSPQEGVDQESALAGRLLRKGEEEDCESDRKNMEKKGLTAAVTGFSSFSRRRVENKLRKASRR